MARDEEVMKALRLAKAHCPSTHLEDTQAWQAGGKEEDVKADSRVRGG